MPDKGQKGETVMPENIIPENSSQNRNQGNDSNENQDDMIFLPESPDTPSFGPPAGEEPPDMPENQPAAPGEDSSRPLPTPSLPGTPPSNMPSRPDITIRPIVPPVPGRPGNGQRPPITIYPIPIIPRPEPDVDEQGYCTIRFLHAAVGYGPLNVLIGNKPVVNHLQYGEVSSYFIETDEIKTINVVDARMRRMTIASETFFFGEDEVYTIGFINGMNGLSMYLIPDISCRNPRNSRSCVRAVNLSYNSPALDITAQAGEIRFEDIRFKTISAYRQMQPGAQEFYVSETLSGALVFQITQEIEAGKLYTLYVIGDAYGAPDMTGIFTEDSSLLFD